MKSFNYLLALTLITSLSLNAGKDRWPKENNTNKRERASRSPYGPCRDVPADDNEYKGLIGCSAAIAIAKCQTSPMQQSIQMVTTSPVLIPKQTDDSAPISPLLLPTLSMHVSASSPVASLIQLDFNEEFPRYPKFSEGALVEKR